RLDLRVGVVCLRRLLQVLPALREEEQVLQLDRLAAHDVLELLLGLLEAAGLEQDPPDCAPVGRPRDQELVARPLALRLVRARVGGLGSLRRLPALRLGDARALGRARKRRLALDAARVAGLSSLWARLLGPQPALRRLQALGQLAQLALLRAQRRL